MRNNISNSHELIALFTPWSAMRSWVWIELGAAWFSGIPILGVFYGMTIGDLDRTGQGKSILEDMNVIGLNDMGIYFEQLGNRIKQLSAK